MCAFLFNNNLAAILRPGACYPVTGLPSFLKLCVCVVRVCAVANKAIQNERDYSNYQDSTWTRAETNI